MAEFLTRPELEVILKHLRADIISAGAPVTFPLEVGRRYRSSNYSVASGGAPIRLNINAENYDPMNRFSNYKFTAGVAGYYQCNGAYQASIQYSSAYYIFIYKNGTSYCQNRHRSDATSGTHQRGLDISDIIPLAVGDYVELWAQFNGTRTVYGGTDITFLSVGLLPLGI